MPATLQIKINSQCLALQLRRRQFRKAFFHLHGLNRGLSQLLFRVDNEVPAAVLEVASVIAALTVLL